MIKINEIVVKESVFSKIISVLGMFMLVRAIIGLSGELALDFNGGKLVLLIILIGITLAFLGFAIECFRKKMVASDEELFIVPTFGDRFNVKLGELKGIEMDDSHFFLLGQNGNDIFRFRRGCPGSDEFLNYIMRNNISIHNR